MSSPCLGSCLQTRGLGFRGFGFRVSTNKGFTCVAEVAFDADTVKKNLTS